VQGDSSIPGGRTLHRKVAFLVIAGLVVSFGLFGYLALEAVRETTEGVFQERLMMARVTAGHIDFQLKESLDYLQAVSRTSGLDFYDSDPEPERRAVAQVLAHLPIFAQHVYLVDRHGNVLMAEPRGTPWEGANVYDYVHIRRVLEGSRYEVSGAILDPVTRKPEVALAVPVHDAAGRTVGALVASADIARASLASLILGLKPGKTGHTQILDGNGTVMASTEPGHLLRRSHHHELLFSLIRQKTTAVVSHRTEEAGKESVREVVAFAPLSHATWGVSVEQHEEEALAVGRELARRMVILGVLSVLGALGTGVIVLRSVLIPVGALTRASERIAAGDLEGPPLIAGSDEVGRLAHTFETMRSRLRQSREELDLWHRELERRVQARTSELSCLFELSKTIASSSDLDDMLKAVVDRVVEILDRADGAYLYLRDPAGDRLVLRTWHGGEPGPLESRYLVLANLALKSGQPLHYCSSQEGSLPERAMPAPSRRTDHGPAPLDSGLITCAPLRTQERALGALLLRCGPGEAELGPSNLSLVQSLADQAAVAIERAQLAQEAEQAAALREADRLKSLFISTITHELQSPLGFIKGYATSLLRRDGDFDEKTKREFLQVISDETDALSALVDDLLDVSRIEAGALSVDKEPVSLGGLVRRSVQRAKAKSELHQFRLRLAAGLPTADADPHRIEQVLRNLLDNAVKYSPSGGVVTVSVALRYGLLVTSVSDEGIGVPHEEQRRVFERFFRGSGAAGASRRGVGLGLSICRGIVEAHGGSIWLESSPGAGTTVSFSLPIAALVTPPSPDAVEMVPAGV
jgi:signal transduction histidine kinase